MVYVVKNVKLCIKTFTYYILQLLYNKMSKTFPITLPITVPRLVRCITVELPCTICRKPTQEDPFSSYFFGACCSTCAIYIDRVMKRWLYHKRLDNNETTRKLFFDILKTKLKIDID